MDIQMKNIVLFDLKTNQSRTVVWLEHLGWPPKYWTFLIVRQNLIFILEKCRIIQLNY